MDRKEKYRKGHREEINRRQRERRAKKPSGFGGVDTELEISESKKRISRLFKLHNTKLPDNLVIIVSWVATDMWNVNRIPIPTKGINDGCTVAMFNKSLTQVGLINYDRLKSHRNKEIGDGGVYYQYEVPPDKFTWFDLQEETFRV